MPKLWHAPTRAQRQSPLRIGAMTNEALTILQMIGVDPNDASQETVALAERLVASSETLDQAAKELASVLFGH
jgi:hypothetical protein